MKTRSDLSMTMKRKRMDSNELQVVSTSIAKFHGDYTSDELNILLELADRLLDLNDELKPGKKKLVPFSPEEKHLVFRCLNDWRNELILDNNLGGIDGITDVMHKFRK